MNGDRLISVGEAAQLLGLCKHTIRQWSNDGRLACVRLPNGHRRFRLSDVRRMMGETNAREDL